jgi:hypothetical protein
MSKLATGILGVFAVSLGFGAVQLAAGRDLAGTQDPARTSEAVNRTTKADRAEGAAGAATASRTISLRLDALSDTSVLIRIPVAKATAKEARSGSPAPSLLKSRDSKATVACEPPVSVLTEVAKQLLPGRCIT